MSGKWSKVCYAIGYVLVLPFWLLWCVCDGFRRAVLGKGDEEHWLEDDGDCSHRWEKR